MKLFVLALGLALSAPAAGPEGVQLWKHSQLDSYEKTLHPKIDAHKIAVEPVANWGNHRMMIAHREGDGQAEMHERQADILIGQSGQATLVTGGSMPHSKNTEPGEFRSAAISGGSSRAFGPGDIVHIPAHTPHQLLVKPGTQFTYVAFKIDVK
ncbi:MAG TPA: hypothetical protein VHD76_22975 [Bryobacteraceae bacterium]|jgi:hypothetical protein|nr:hypothetical protein [Bryobacteraceae bacterium]